MTSTPSAILGFELQGQNDNTSAWWANANQIFQSTEDAIAKEVPIATTGGDTALTLVAYAVDQSRCPIIRIGSGQTLLSNVRITTARARIYFVTNETAAGAFTVGFGGNTSNQVTIPRGSGAYVRVRSDATTTFASPLVVLATGLIDLTSIAVGTYLAGANNLSDLANAATARANLGVAIGSNVQAYAANLTSYAALSPTALLATLLESTTVVPFFQAAAPTGWTKLTSHNDKAIRIVSGSSGGSPGGSGAFSTTFASRTPAGSVAAPIGSATLSSGAVYPVTVVGAANANRLIVGVGVSIGGSGVLAGDVAMSVSLSAPAFTGTAMDFAVAYLDMILCQRN